MEPVASSDEPERLEHCLRALAHGHGVWRDDLVDLLKGGSSPLQRHWNINLDSGVAAVRHVVVSNLRSYIENLRPEWTQRRVDPDEVRWRKQVVIISFNATPDKELAVLHRKNLQERRDWLRRTYSQDRNASMRTLQRILEEAIEQIAERMVNIAAGAALPTEPAAELAAPVQPPLRPHDFLAHLVELSSQVQHALSAARDACQSQDRAFYTSDVLLTLLDLPGSRAAQCFDVVRLGLPASIREQLAATLKADRHHEPFVPFTWLERSDVQLAGQYAISNGQPIVTDLHLLLAILDGESATNRWLRRFLGEEHRQVRAVVERHRRAGPTVINSPTPDGM